MKFLLVRLLRLLVLYRALRVNYRGSIFRLDRSSRGFMLRRFFFCLGRRALGSAFMSGLSMMIWFHRVNLEVIDLRIILIDYVENSVVLYLEVTRVFQPSTV